MKQLVIAILMSLTMIGAVLAAGDDLAPKDITMAQDDTVFVDYCVDNYLPADGTVDIRVEPVCEDFDGISGCSAADDETQTEFTAVPTGDITLVGGAGCTQIELTTEANALGLFYYTVNGDIGAVQAITSETGSVEVPEFGILAAFGVLGLAGLFIYRKRH